MFFKIAQMSVYIWATFEAKYFTQNFIKSPNLVTLVGALLAWEGGGDSAKLFGRGHGLARCSGTTRMLDSFRRVR